MAPRTILSKRFPLRRYSNNMPHDIIHKFPCRSTFPFCSMSQPGSVCYSNFGSKSRVQNNLSITITDGAWMDGLDNAYEGHLAYHLRLRVDEKEPEECLYKTFRST